MADVTEATGENAVAPGSESSPAAPAESNSSAAQAPSDQGTWQPDERYKGMQRELQRAKDRESQMESELQAARQAAGSGNPQDAQAVMAVLRELAATGPEGMARAQQLAVQIDTANTRAENDRLRNAQTHAEQVSQINRLRDANMAELRETAKDLGADPDSSLIDYGTDNDPLFERIKKVRASAKAAVKPATPTAPAPAAAANTSHNTQPGTAPAPVVKTTATAEEVEAAQAAYGRNPTLANMKVLEDLTEKWSATAF